MKIAILGGGISGLGAAWHLLKKEPKAKITLFEASHRLGGWIESKTQDGFLFELGPRTFQTGRCPELLGMIRELGLQPIFSEKGGSKFLWHKGQMRPLSSFWPQLLRAAAQDLIAQRGKREEESIESFAKRRMGKKAAELFLIRWQKESSGATFESFLSKRLSHFSSRRKKKSDRSSSGCLNRRSERRGYLPLLAEWRL